MKELTIIDQVKDIEAKSGVQFELDITEVVSLATRAKKVTTVEDPNFLPIKKEMQQKRKYVTEYFEAARKEVNKTAKGIIEVQRVVLSEFTGEEDRLIALDKAEKERLVTEARLEALPAKRERITTAGIEFTDEQILALADADFELAFATALAVKVEADRVVAETKLAEERAVFEAEKVELERQKNEANRIEQARVEERERAEKALQIAKDTAIREATEAEERRKAEDVERMLRVEREEADRVARIEREEADRVARIEREAKQAEEKKAQEENERLRAEAKREADKKYQAFLAKNNYSADTDIIKEEYTGTRIYRFVAEFKQK